jgi:hypothetical protein
VAVATGTSLTVTVSVTVTGQLLVPVYTYVIVAVPAATPVTTPVDEFTEATDVLEELQDPPVVAFAKVVVWPTQTDAVPVMGEGVLEPTTGPATKFEVVPVFAKPLMEPVLPLGPESVMVEMAVLFPLAVP